MAKAEDLTGRVFSRLTVTGRTDNNKYGRTQWSCRCQCGELCIVAAGNLKSGNTKSCGCYNDETRRTKPITHGLSGTSLYTTWTGMKQRCTNPNNEAYKDYGGRGIRVCDRWFDSFEKFRRDMGPRPSVEHELDRRDNDRDYEPGNCRWVKKAANCQNRRSTRLNEQAVKVIRYFHMKHGFSQRRIANAYGIQRSLVGKIVRREIWKNVSDVE